MPHSNGTVGFQRRRLPSERERRRSWRLELLELRPPRETPRRDDSRDLRSAEGRSVRGAALRRGALR